MLYEPLPDVVKRLEEENKKMHELLWALAGYIMHKQLKEEGKPNYFKAVKGGLEFIYNEQAADELKKYILMHQKEDNSNET